VDNRANRCWRLETRIPDPRLAPQVENEWLVRYAIYLDNCHCGCFGGGEEDEGVSKEGESKVEGEKREGRAKNGRDAQVGCCCVVVVVVIMGGRQGK